MSYEVRLRRAAQKGLDSLTQRDYKAIAKAISALEANPRPQGVKKLTDTDLWRIRWGRHGIVYAIDDKSKSITVVRIAKRKEDTYKGL
ncbi:MAG: hypothetical protein A2Y59_02325 [Chloroflexi bacterium RBG_13_52_14]|nr:MAG: hypothetical protein A2Y59_02325 [Chloroflexi bacterium RBG_13_52_14]